MEERKRQLSLLLLMVMLVAANALVGGPWLPPLPSLSPEVVKMIPFICLSLMGLLGLVLFLAATRETEREQEDRIREMQQSYEQRRRILERQHQIARDPNAPPETLKEQLERKKLGL